MSPYQLLSERDINIYTGKALVGVLTKDEQMALCNHITALEMKLDEADYADTFGTEGWRHYFGVPESD